MPKAAKTLSVQPKIEADIVRIGQRENSNKRGYGWRWQKYRIGFLKKNPLCVHCKENDVITTATDVDHKIPAKPSEPLFWDKSNHQGLCHSCHSIKTATEDGGFGHKKLVRR